MKPGRLLLIITASGLLVGAGWERPLTQAPEEARSPVALPTGDTAGTVTLKAVLERVSTAHGAHEYGTLWKAVEGRPESVALWREQEDALRWFHALMANHEPFVLDRDVYPSKATRPPWVTLSRSASTLYSAQVLRSWALAEQGEHRRGLAELRDMTLWLDQLADLNGLHSLSLLSVAHERYLLPELWQLTSAYGDAEDLAALERLLDDLEAGEDSLLPSLAEICQRHRDEAEGFAADPAGFSPRSVPTRTRWDRFESWLLFDLEGTLSLLDEQCGQMAQDLTRPYHAAPQAPWSQLGELALEWTALSNQTGLRMLSGYSRLERRSFHIWDRQASTRAGLRVAVAGRRYTLAEGQPPAGLDALVPVYLAEPVLDPYTGEWPRYAPESGRLLAPWTATWNTWTRWQL